MDFHIDLDPTQLVVRGTITAAVLTEQLADDYYRALSRVASRGGPYAAIFDLSVVTRTTMSHDAIRGLASRPPAVPAGRTRVIAAKEPHIYGLARMFQLSRDFMGGQFQVVRYMEEAYEMIGVRPADFTERLFPTEMDA